MRSVSVILIHWDQPAACVRTIQRFAELDEVGQILVVDNGSTTENQQRLATGVGQAHLPIEVDTINVGFNSGFGPAANRGWERWLADPEGTEWSIIAPHDALPADNTIGLMLDAAEANPSAGLLCADVGDGQRPMVDHVFGPILVPATGVAGFEAADYPHGTLAMASRTCLSRVGLFDERYFSYCEEADLGLRAKKAGFAVGIVRGAMVENPTVSTSTPMVEYLMERNTILLMLEHFGRRKAAMRFAIAIGQLIAGTFSSQRRTPYWSAHARRLAIVDALKGKWGAPSEGIWQEAS